MRLLLDTSILIALAPQQLPRLGARTEAVIRDAANAAFASVASLWEIAIKTRLGKLDPGLPLADLPGYLESIGLALLSIDHHHAVTLVEPLPATRDPFDQLLLAQCQVEGMRLVTIDRALLHHPLAWRAE